MLEAAGATTDESRRALVDGFDGADGRARALLIDAAGLSVRDAAAAVIWAVFILRAFGSVDRRGSVVSVRARRSRSICSRSNPRSVALRAASSGSAAQARFISATASSSLPSAWSAAASSTALERLTNSDIGRAR